MLNEEHIASLMEIVEAAIPPNVQGEVRDSVLIEAEIVIRRSLRQGIPCSRRLRAVFRDNEVVPLYTV